MGFDSDEIPDYIFEGLAMYVAPTIAMEFGRAFEPTLQEIGLKLMRGAIVNRNAAKQPGKQIYY